jgi:anti-sigma B factor antagonist
MVIFEKRGNADIVTFSVNKINALIADEIRDSISKLFEQPHAKVIIDLKGVEYIDSSGFGCFLSILRTARNNYGAIKIANPEQAVKLLFETLHLHTVFDICPDMEDCLKSFR